MQHSHGARLRLLRQRAEMTQCALSAATGISQGEISRLESDRSYLGATRLRRIAAALNVTPADIIA